MANIGSFKKSGNEYQGEIRRIPADPVVPRHDWLEAYRFVTDRGAVTLNDFARTNDPFSKVGRTQISVEVASVVGRAPGGGVAR